MVKTKPASNVEASSGNVFADLRLPDPEELSTKVRLSVALNDILDDRKLNQADAAKILGVNQPKISALRAYKLDGFSVGRLMHYLTLLGYNVIIRISPAKSDTATESVLVVKAA